MPETSTVTRSAPSPEPEQPGGPSGTEMIEEFENYSYRDDLDYLEDLRMLLLERSKTKPSMAGCPFESAPAREIRTRIERRLARTRRNGVELRLDLLTGRCRLDETEKLLIAALAIQQITGEQDPIHVDRFFRAIADEEIRGLLAVRNAARQLAEKKITLRKGTGRLEHSPQLHPGIFRFIIEGTAFPDGFDAEREDPKDTVRDLAGRSLARFPRPRDLYRELSRRVVGQENVLRTLSVAAFEHLTRLAAGEPPEKGVKKNVLLAGPTGCGKTHIVSTLAGLLGLPSAAGDATSWTEEGYVGMSFDEVFYRLFLAGGVDIEKAQAGIVFIDEVDKLAASGVGGRATGDRDVGGAGVQRALLKALDGGKISITPGGSHSWRGSAVEFDTSPTLIILGGAFTGIERIIEERRRDRGLGFGADVSGRTGRKEPPGTDDLVRYGLLREFAGRIPVVAHLDRLTEQQLVRILSDGEHSLLAAVNREARLHGLGFSFTAGALRAIAAAALKKGTGARSLRGTLNRIIEPHVFANARTGGRRKKEIRITVRNLPQLD
ncbi:MAG: AAA family ATPase [Candidatus Erginobacter occultus]|nr:AAA family ATPase [Candidatus Erginobacter occultus]